MLTDPTERNLHRIGISSGGCGLQCSLSSHLLPHDIMHVSQLEGGVDAQNPGKDGPSAPCISLRETGHLKLVAIFIKKYVVA